MAIAPGSAIEAQGCSLHPSCTIYWRHGARGYDFVHVQSSQMAVHPELTTLAKRRRWIDESLRLMLNPPKWRPLPQSGSFLGRQIFTYEELKKDA